MPRRDASGGGAAECPQDEGPLITHGLARAEDFRWSRARLGPGTPLTTGWQTSAAVAPAEASGDFGGRVTVGGWVDLMMKPSEVASTVDVAAVADLPADQFAAETGFEFVLQVAFQWPRAIDRVITALRRVV